MIARPSSRRAILVCAAALLGAVVAQAQELTPAAYLPAPRGASYLSLSTTYSSGDLSFDPSAPIDESSTRIRSAALTYGRALGLFGRSATVTLAVPYVDGEIEGIVSGEQAQASRSGQADVGARLAINLLGAPAMTAPEFAKLRVRTLIGVSLSVTGPTGEYDSAKLINIGTNRWAMKPEVGFVRVVGPWAFDVYLAAAFFTTNDDFYGGQTREQDPVYSTQTHARFRIRPDLWAAADANFWRGGQTSLDGVERDDLQRNSRVGLTVAWQPARRHGLRLAASRGAITRIGGDFDSVGLSYNYSWLAKP